MSHLLITENHQQLLLKDAEFKPAREVHVIVVAGLVGPAYAAAEGDAIEVHATEASKRSRRGSLCKSPPKSSKYVARGMPHKPKSYPPKHSKGNYHKCERKNHFARECRAPPYLVNTYRELQQLCNQSCQNYNFDIHSLTNLDVKNYMTIYGQTTSNSDVAPLDSALIYTILTNPIFFFPVKETS